MIPLYDSRSDKNKTGTPLPGMLAIHCAGNEFFAGAWPNLDKTKPDEAGTKAVAHACWEKQIPLVVNIEHWAIDIRTAKDSVVDENLDKLAQVFTWCHEAERSLKCGLYSFMPLRSYWERIDGRERQWMDANERIADRLLPLVDVLYPSLYTFYDEISGWIAYARDNIKEARRIGRGRPVVPFLWPQFHESNATLGGKPLSREFFEAQLATVNMYADGAVIWGGWQREWREDAAWWRATKEVI